MTKIEDRIGEGCIISLLLTHDSLPSSEIPTQIIIALSLNQSPLYLPSSFRLNHMLSLERKIVSRELEIC